MTRSIDGPKGQQTRGIQESGQKRRQFRAMFSVKIEERIGVKGELRGNEGRGWEGGRAIDFTFIHFAIIVILFFLCIL